jgi:hypothetical protein
VLAHAAEEVHAVWEDVAALPCANYATLRVVLTLLAHVSMHSHINQVTTRTMHIVYRNVI